MSLPAPPAPPPPPPRKSSLRDRYLTQFQGLVLGGLIVLVGIIVTFTLNRNAEHIQTNTEHIRAATYQACLVRQDNVERFNRTLEELARIERANATPTSEQRAQVFLNGRAPVPECTQ